MGCCGSNETSERNYRKNTYGNNQQSYGAPGETNHDPEEIQRKRMEYYNRPEVKNKQIIRNFDY